MKNTKVAVAIPVLVLVLGMVLSGCAMLAPTGKGISTEKASWVEFTVIPSKDYTVVGAIVIRATEATKTLNADLMEKAIEMGAHDIINVRIDVETSSTGQRIWAATALAIKYTNETLKEKEGESYVISSGGGSEPAGSGVPSGDSSGGGKKKILGLF